jgi:shikimate kinase
MRGVGRATGAVTIVNALFTGFGSALAIDLPIEAVVELGPTAAESGAIEEQASGPFARAALTDALRGFGEPSADGRLEVRSSIPPRRGLKSSSALGVAVVRAAADALGRAIPEEEAARRAARFAREYGESATGAFDDALAAAAGGIVVTDNRSDAVVLRAPAPPDCVAVLDLEQGEHRPPVAYRDQFVRHAALASGAVESARRGDWWTAMEQNSAAVERALGVDRSERRSLARSLGALGSGISGVGPAFASILPRDRLAEFLRAFPEGRSARLVVGLPGATPTGGTRIR